MKLDVEDRKRSAYEGEPVFGNYVNGCFVGKIR